MPLQFHNSDDVSVTGEGEREFFFVSTGQDGVIRLVFHTPDNPAHLSVDMRAKIRVQLESGAIGHISIVNGDVSEGRMIDAPEMASGVSNFEIGGVFRPFSGHALLVVTLNGPSRGHCVLEELSITQYETSDAPKVLFFIDPWLDRNNAFSKDVYMPWFRQQAAALLQAFPAYSFRMVCNEALLQSFHADDLPFPVHGLRQEALQELFPSFRAAMTQWCGSGGSEAVIEASSALVKRELGDFKPDIILATAPAPYLNAAYPDALLLYTDGLHFRPPWPDGCPMFDPTGYRQGAILPLMAREIEQDPSASQFMESYRRIVDRDAEALRNFIIRKIEMFRKRFDRIVVLALQDLQHHFAFTAHPYETQIDYVIATLDRIGSEIGVILAQHPDRQDLDAQTMHWLVSKFPNLINDPQLNELKAPSQALMPHVDGLVTTSSGLIYQAGIRQKPAFLTHPTAYSALAHARSLDAIQDPAAYELDAAQVDTEIAWILRHHAVPHAFLLHTSWLHDRLVRLCESKRQDTLTWQAMPRIGGDATILDWLVRHLRPGADDVPPAEVAVVVQERAKYERMYNRAEYHSNDAVLATARELLLRFDLKPPATVLDVGCGPGSASLFLKNLGYTVFAIDIAYNCLDKDKRGKFPLLITSIWELQPFVRGDAFLCADVMEHIPPEFVSKTLETLSQACRSGGLFVISLRPDDCGRLIGETLHLSVQPLDWWVSELQQFWSGVEVLHHDEQAEFALFKVAHQA